MRHLSFAQFQSLMLEASYKGNIGIMELNKFFAKTKKDHPDLYKKVWKLIDSGDSKEVWRIIQDFLKVDLVDK